MTYGIVIVTCIHKGHAWDTYLNVSRLVHNKSYLDICLDFSPLTFNSSALDFEGCVGPYKEDWFCNISPTSKFYKNFAHKCIP